jgi:DNA-binding MarR family transcriptional regulator
VPTSPLQQELQQSKPFDSPAVEAYLNLLRTYDHLSGDMSRFMKRRGISQPQYNVLRILRGAGSAGLPSLAVAERMVARVPDITRLLDRMASKGWVKRTRSKEDRRVVIAQITPKGTRFLAALDGPLQDFQRDLMGHMSKKQIESLSALLVLARSTP